MIAGLDVEQEEWLESHVDTHSRHFASHFVPGFKPGFVILLNPFHVPLLLAFEFSIAGSEGLSSKKRGEV
jgi:hypothetical protein